MNFTELDGTTREWMLTRFEAEEVLSATLDEDAAGLVASSRVSTRP